jgi:hypothetical protein
MKHFLLYPFLFHIDLQGKRFPFNTITHFSNEARYGKITR